MTKKRKIDVLIDGRNFTVLGAEDEDYIIDLARYVDKKIKELTSKNDKLCQTMSATLAALNIADEYNKAKTELEELKKQSRDPIKKYGNAISKLDKAENKIKALELQCIEYKDESFKAKIHIASMAKEIEKLKLDLEEKAIEQEKEQKTIKALQDKIFDNQIELIESKKELEEVIKRLDSGKNIFAEEEV